MSNVLAAFEAFQKHGKKMTPRKDGVDNHQVKTASNKETAENELAEAIKSQPTTDVLQPEKDTQALTTDRQKTPQEASMPTNNTPESKIAENNSQKAKFLPIVINIAGASHRITCPADEVKTLEDSVLQINNKIRSIRQDIKGRILTNEELLVLTCLELYDEIRALQELTEAQDVKQDQAMALVEKMIKDVKSAL